MPPARATVVLVGLSCAAYLIEIGTGQVDALITLAGFIPARVMGGLTVDQGLTPVSATFLHASLLQLAFNMILLGYCGRAAERVLVGFGIATLYVVGAFAAAGAYYAADPSSPYPLFGAGGAGSAVIAAYAIFYGERKPFSANPRVARMLHIAWLAAGWLGLQLLVGLASPGGGLIATVAAPVGGFFAGLLLAQPLLRWRYRNA